MKFKISTSSKSNKGELEYISSERSFYYKQSGRGDHASTAALIVAGSLQIEFDIDTGRLLYVGGYSPDSEWVFPDEELILSSVRQAEVFADEVDDDLMVGAGYDTNLTDLHPKRYRDGKFVIGYPEDADEIVEFADNTFIGLKDGDLKAVILCPQWQ